MKRKHLRILIPLLCLAACLLLGLVLLQKRPGVEIGELSVRIAPPEPGRMPSYRMKLPLLARCGAGLPGEDYAGYGDHLSDGVVWIDMTRWEEERQGGFMTPGGEAFTAGHWYALVLFLAPDDGCRFADPASGAGITVRVNGAELDPDGWGNDVSVDDGVLVVAYVFPEPCGGAPAEG